VEGNSIISQ